MEASGHETSLVRTERDTSREIDLRMRSVAAGQHGRISRPQLTSLGANGSAIVARVRNGMLVRVARGVYALAPLIATPQAAWMTALLRTGPDASLSHASAGAAWSIRPSQAALIDLTTPHRKRPIEGIRLHRRNLPADEITGHHGLRLSTPSRTIFDLAQHLSDAQLEGAIAVADELELDFTPSLPELLARYPEHRGTRRLRRVHERIGGASARRLRSEVEADFLDLVLEAGWPRVETNFMLRLEGHVFELDAAWPAIRLAIELDSRAFHGSWTAAESDRERDRILLRRGWRVVRVTARMLGPGRAALRADLDALIYTPALAPT